MYNFDLDLKYLMLLFYFLSHNFQFIQVGISN